jgi:hypothetical protein
MTPKTKDQIRRINRAFAREFERERREWPDGRWFPKTDRPAPIRHYVTDAEFDEKLRQKKAAVNQAYRQRKASS